MLATELCDEDGFLVPLLGFLGLKVNGRLVVVVVEMVVAWPPVPTGGEA